MKLRKTKLVALAMTAAMVFSTASAFACTGAYVGKDVSTDGTTIIARSEGPGLQCLRKNVQGSAESNKSRSLLCR